MSESKDAKPPNVFVGASFLCLMSMHRAVGVDHWLLPSKHEIPENIQRLASAFDLKIGQFDNRSHAMDLIKTIGPGKHFQMAGFPYRLLDEHISQFEYVYNLHPGDLRNNRGREPMHQSILRGDEFFCLSQHQVVDESLDSGPVNIISKVPVSYDTTFNVNVESVLRVISGMLYTHYFAFRDKKPLTTYKIHVDDESYLSRLSSEVIAEIENAPNLMAYKKL